MQNGYFVYDNVDYRLRTGARVKFVLLILTYKVTIDSYGSVWGLRGLVGLGHFQDAITRIL